MEKVIILEIPYGGLGDHLFHSHIPRIAKQTNKFEKVYISSKSLLRHPDYIKLVWELNPYIDGFRDEHGIICDIEYIVKNIRKGYNLLDEVMVNFGLDDGLRMHEPEVYYKPNYKSEYNKVIYDPNFLSWVGEMDKDDAMYFFKNNNYHFDAIMKIRTDKALYKESENELYIETPTLFDFCDLIFSCKHIYCLTSGTATLAAAMRKPATVFFGNSQYEAFQHSKQHKYVKIEKRPLNKVKSLLKSVKRKIN